MCDLACRCITFSIHMGLSFERTRAVGARASEKSIAQRQGPTSNHKFNINDYKNYFLTKNQIALNQIAQLLIKQEFIMKLNNDLVNQAKKYYLDLDMLHNSTQFLDAKIKI